jgi:hypothetical protein
VSILTIAVTTAGLAALAGNEKPQDKPDKKSQSEAEAKSKEPCPKKGHPSEKADQPCDERRQAQKRPQPAPKGRKAIQPGPAARLSIAEAARQARAQREKSRALEAAKKKTSDGETRIVITNDVLEKVFGPSSPSPSSPEYGKLLKEGQKQGAKSGEGSGKQADGASAEERAAQIEAEIDRLQKRLIGLRNPYLPRGEATEEEREKEEGKDAVARVRMIEEKIDSLEQELLSLRQKRGDR